MRVGILIPLLGNNINKIRVDTLTFTYLMVYYYKNKRIVWIHTTTYHNTTSCSYFDPLGRGNFFAMSSLGNTLLLI